MNYFDPVFVAAARSIQAPDYLGEFYRSFNLAESLPWSARKQREQAIQDHQMAMQTARFQADMADRAKQNQIQDMLLPYKLQHAQRLAQGPQTFGGVGGNSEDERILQLAAGFGAPAEVAAPKFNPIPTNDQIPTIDVESNVEVPVQDIPNLEVIPDLPEF